MTETKIIDITNNNRNKHGKMFKSDEYRYGKRKRVASGDYYGGDFMSSNYITRPEFEQHQKHMDAKFDNVELKIDKAVNDLKDEINKKKLTTTRFWIGVSIPAVIGVANILIPLFT